MMKFFFIWIVSLFGVFISNSLYAQITPFHKTPPVLIDLSKQCNLNDNLDDSDDLLSVIRKMGPVGGFWIPSGKLILEQPIIIRSNRFTILGGGSEGATIELRKEGQLLIGGFNSSFIVRDIAIDTPSGQVETLLKFANKGNGNLIIRDFAVASFGGKWENAVHVMGFDNVTFDKIEVRNVQTQGTAFKFTNNGNSLLATNIELANLDHGLSFEDPFKYAQLTRFDLFQIKQGVKFNTSLKENFLQITESIFKNCLKAISIEGASKFTIMNCLFHDAAEFKIENENITINHENASGMFHGNKFGRGVVVNNADHIGLSGNLFQDGFVPAEREERVYLALEKAALLQLEANQFKDPTVKKVDDLQGENKIVFGQTVDLSKQ